MAATNKEHASVTHLQNGYLGSKRNFFILFSSGRSLDVQVQKILCVQTSGQLLTIFEGGVVPLRYAVRRVIHPCSWAISPNTTSINTS